MRKIFILVAVLALLCAAAFFLYCRATKPKPTNRYAIGLVTTYAGTGAPGNEHGAREAASFTDPFGVAVDQQANIYVADTYNDRIRKIPPDGNVSTFAGSSESERAGALTIKLDTPCGVAVDALGNVFIADTGNNEIHQITPGGGVVNLLSNEAGLDVVYQGSIRPIGLIVTHDNFLYFSTADGCYVNQINPGKSFTFIA